MLELLGGLEVDYDGKILKVKYIIIKFKKSLMEI